MDMLVVWCILLTSMDYSLIFSLSSSCLCLSFSYFSLFKSYNLSWVGLFFLSTNFSSTILLDVSSIFGCIVVTTSYVLCSFTSLIFLWTFSWNLFWSSKNWSRFLLCWESWWVTNWGWKVQPSKSLSFTSSNLYCNFNYFLASNSAILCLKSSSLKCFYK